MPYVRRKSRMSRRPRRTTKNRRPSNARVPRGLAPSVYRFKRDIEQTLALSQSTPPEGWTADSANNGLYSVFGWSLGALGDSGDFTSLFRDYRIKGARVKMFFSNTQSSTDNPDTFANSQILVRMVRLQDGGDTALSLPFFQQTQAKKYKLAINGGKPLDIYMPLKQANEVTSSTGTANTMMTPKFVSTAANNVQHYGMGIRMERVDGQPFTSGYNNKQYCKMITTLYLETRQVQ
ncbi:MAG: hypothetical protein [Cressdnaviricota sp.]|nr:MAG: hypothetical protein [Cressdnaviricota sp.]